MVALSNERSFKSVGSDTFVEREYDALRAEERDRMNARMQVWTLYLTVVGAFSFVALQSGLGVYVVALCPLVLACLSRYARHNEDVLKQLRKYLYQLEQKNGYCGYEHFTGSVVRPTHGGYRSALRDAFLLTDVLALVSVLVRLSVDRVFLAIPVVLLIDVFAIVVTCFWLSKARKRRKERN